MIRFIAAIDSKRGIADDHGLPWASKVPDEVADFRAKIQDGLILMGYDTYVVVSKPLNPAINYVATSKDEPLREGFQTVKDARAFIRQATQDIWNIGGAILFASTLDLADELYLTQIEGDFHCTKFFPPYEDKFVLAEESQPITENGITYRFQRYVRKT